jgi:hypothetical protein
MVVRFTDYALWPVPIRKILVAFLGRGIGPSQRLYLHSIKQKIVDIFMMGAGFEPTNPVFQLSRPLWGQHEGRYKCISLSPLLWHQLIQKQKAKNNPILCCKCYHYFISPIFQGQARLPHNTRMQKVILKIALGCSSSHLNLVETMEN